MPRPNEPQPLTYDQATPEQVAEARETARRKLADSVQRHDAAYWERLRARFGFPTRTA